MDAHQKLLIQLIKEERQAVGADSDFYTAKQISIRSGVNESTLSRFLNGKQDLKAGDYFAVIKSFSEDFQERFWMRLHRAIAKTDWRSQIMAANYDEIQEILEALTEKWAAIEMTRRSAERRRSADSSKTKVAV
jgi:transcriptional regulator with XRE-family HTH domain